MKKISFIIICLILLTGCSNSLDSHINVSYSKEDEFLELINSIDDAIYVNSYTIYGRFFNLEGEISEYSEDLKLVFKSLDDEIEYDLLFNEDNTIFKTNELINTGINLENISEGNYLILLKSDDKYYHLKSKNELSNLTYYTITRNNTNKKIDISFKDNNKTYLSLECQTTTLDDEYYDIVLDAGHGGKDLGAVKNGKYESNINLDYVLSLKESFEELGLKVKLTRDKDIFMDTYGEDGRVSITYKTKAKLMLSIHQNSSTGNISSGVEIYAATNSDYKFASSVAKNIVDLTSTNYSKNTSYQVAKGVYARTLSKSDIESINQEAKENGYTIYDNLNTKISYYYIIRETGGIITHAYVDGRNKSKNVNPYYKSNHGTESYLLELGYISNQENLDILLKEKDNYIKAITKSVQEYLNI